MVTAMPWSPEALRLEGIQAGFVPSEFSTPDPTPGPQQAARILGGSILGHSIRSHVPRGNGLRQSLAMDAGLLLDIGTATIPFSVPQGAGPNHGVAMAPEL